MLTQGRPKMMYHLTSKDFVYTKLGFNHCIHLALPRHVAFVHCSKIFLLFVSTGICWSPSCASVCSCSRQVWGEWMQYDVNKPDKLTTTLYLKLCLSSKYYTTCIALRLDGLIMCGLDNHSTNVKFPIYWRKCELNTDLQQTLNVMHNNYET